MDCSAALLDQNRLLRELVGAAHPDTAVATCPGWTLRSLVTHVGRGDRWAAAIARDGAPVDIRTVADGKPPADDVGPWLTASATALLDAVAAAGADTPVWTFLGPRPAAWWIRRRLHESTVHRADAALALGVPYELEPTLASDGIGEWLGLLAHRRPAEGPPGLDDGVTLHLHATDDDWGEWIVRGTAGPVAWEPGHAKASVAVRGPATDLLLALLRRVPADRPQVLGDEQVWRTWLERTHF